VDTKSVLFERHRRHGADQSVVFHQQDMMWRSRQRSVHRSIPGLPALPHGRAAEPTPGGKSVFNLM
jgi:hypothetical protein